MGHGTIHGNEGIIKIGAGFAALGHIQSWSLDVKADVLEGYSMGEAWAIALAVTLFPRDANGARIFADDAETLENQVDPTVLSRIAAEMMRSTTKADLGN